MSESPPRSEVDTNGQVEATADDLARLEALPRELGVMCLVLGVGGLVLPAPVGVPFLLMGGAVLYPRVFEPLRRAFQRRFPALHQRSLQMLDRFADDLDHRYPRAESTDSPPESGARSDTNGPDGGCT